MWTENYEKMNRNVCMMQLVSCDLKKKHYVPTTSYLFICLPNYDFLALWLR